MKWVREFGRQALHVGILSATAWALLATSAPDMPPRDCFTTLPNPDSLDVSIGPPRSAVPGSDAGSFADAQANADGSSELDGSPASDGGDAGLSPPADPVSCRGLDGVAPGTVLSFDISKDNGSAGSGGVCLRYTTRAITPLSGVTLTDTGPGYYRAADDDTFTLAVGEFESPSAEGCRGSWFLELRPETDVDAGTLVSPLDASSSSRWLLTRSIDIAQAQFCDGTFPEVGGFSCTDTFVVTTIEETP
ncbi:MAG TPA: hypothetical protein VGI39_41900 [Polyangiaceae bacterium]|jgi:hypothetical protein